jgi:hypothetical protein
VNNLDVTGTESRSVGTYAWFSTTLSFYRLISFGLLCCPSDTNQKHTVILLPVIDIPSCVCPEENSLSYVDRAKNFLKLCSYDWSI